MINLYKFIALLVLCLCTTAALAQNTSTVELLLGQPGLSEQLGELTPQVNAAQAPSSVPTAETAQTANADDVQQDTDVLVQSLGEQDSPPSVIQQYFKILTGRSLEIYGAQEFSQKQDEQLLFFNTVGKNYRLAPGDVVRVTLRGLNQSNESYKIGNDGSLTLPNLPPVAVSGMTIAEVEKSLLDVIQYDDASALVFISLETARLITVQVSGAVNQPRTLAIPAYTPLSRVLAYVGGVNATGSLRNIVLSDRNGSGVEIDFYDFLQSPLGSNDPLVTDSSRIFVPNQGATVATSGFVARPGIYELPFGQDEIALSDLLKLSGMSILPPGLVLEAKYFDASGVSRTRFLSMNDSIAAGEVLNLRFVETRLQGAITVFGAVLDEYSMASDEPISVQEVLKDGATLKRDARLDFAMIVGGDGAVRSINLERALQTNVQKIPVGSALVVFDQKSYRRLVNADPNATDDPLVAAMAQAEVAEFYLNGERLAFVPPEKAVGFAAMLRPYYRLTPSTNLEMALVESPDGTARAVSLRDLMQGVEPFTLLPGAKVHLFETAFLTSFYRRLDTGPSDTTALTDLGRSAPLARLLLRSGVLRVKLDGILVAVLPASSTQKMETVLDVLGLEQSVSTLADFVEIGLQSTQQRPKFTSLSLIGDYQRRMPDAQTIGFWSRKGFFDYLKTADQQEIKRLFSIGVPVFVDYDLKEILSPSAFDAVDAVDAVAARLVFDQQNYSLFSVLKKFDRQLQLWENKVQLPSEILQPNLTDVKAGNQLFLFSRDFIANQLNTPSEVELSSTDKARTIEQFASQERAVVPEESVDAQSLTNEQSRLIEESLSETTQRLNDAGIVQTDTALIASYSRFVGGAVQYPGQYPIAGPVSLRRIIDSAGGALANADLSQVAVQYQREESGALVRGQRKVFNISKNASADPRLSGRFFVDLPFFINEAATGVVTISGEVMRPGRYVIARDETLHGLIKRAGGFSPVAYPLGAVFARQSLKESEREYNDLLATQLEQAVLSIASSDNDNAGDQVNALLRYAQQLRAQQPTGRMSVNVIYEQKDTPVYLQEADSLIIPKRPSHVTIIGAVNRGARASYEPGKTLAAYLAAAGGATRLADLKRSFLLLPNGESTPISQDILIPPGAAIVVTPRTDRLSILGLTDLVSRVMGNIATSILAINNVR